MKKLILSLKSDLPYVCIFSIAFSLIGWGVENGARVFGNSAFDNRFHFLPFISCYGLAAIGAYIIGDPDNFSFFGLIKTNKKIINNLMFFLFLMIAVYLGEEIIGNLYEQIAGVVLWDYTWMAIHFSKYTSLLSILGFAIVGFIAIKFVFFPLLNLSKKKIDRKYTHLYPIFYLITIIDEIIMIIKTMINGEAPIYYYFNLDFTFGFKVLFDVGLTISAFTFLGLLLFILGYLSSLIDKLITQKKQNIK